MKTIINKIKNIFKKNKLKVITIKRNEENKKEIPLNFTDTLFSFYFNNLTTEEILFQLKRDNFAKTFLKEINI
ncbi:MAG: hypothetical protein E7342_01480 [Clostridiales bacterium]|nr:hypothetical protein [Clostridiales bacterium]